MYQVIVNGSVVAEFDLYSEAEEFASMREGAEVELLEDDPEEWDDPWDEVGYDPYMGGYSWDC